MSEPSSPTAGSAETVVLGGDLELRRVGFGARWIARAGHDKGRALLRRAVELGVNLIDTADTYAGEWSERLIADALYPYPEDLVIATKGGQVVIDGKASPDGRPEHLREACEASLRRLHLEAIDLYQLHSPDPEVPLAESLGALGELQAEGKVKHIGGSNLFGDDLKLAMETVRLVSVQNQLNLVRRRSDRVVRRCEQAGIVFMPWQPLRGGELARGDGELATVAAAHEASAAQVALAWLLFQSPSIVPIPGTSSIEHLEENVGAAGLRLAQDELRRLSQSFAGAT